MRISLGAVEKEPTGETDRPHVVIVGGGFGGLYAPKALQRCPVDVTLVDRRNFHLFQPLPDLSAKAEAALRRLGVTVRSRTDVREIQDDVVTLRCGDAVERLAAGTVLWSAMV